MAETGRRSFINWFLGTSFGALAVSTCYPIFRFMSPPDVPEATTDEVEAGPTNDPDLMEKGYKIVRFGAEPVILVKVSDTEFKAFAGTCTHLDCIVEYRNAEQVLWCNCHNGAYDLTGSVVGGPPPKPLETFDVHVVEKGSGQPGTVIVKRS